MGPIVLQIAAFIFIGDAAFLFGKADPKGTGVANAIIGGLMAIMGLQIGFTAGGDTFLMILASLSVAFAMFYLILGWSLLKEYDLKAVGWYSLGAGLWCLLAAIFFFGTDWIFGIFALTWCALFLAAWGNLSFDHVLAGTVTRWILAVDSIIVLMLPAYLLIIGRWPPF
ncbi:MAG: AmiS/UreI family transporter [Anaerolineae bacterium]